LTYALFHIVWLIAVFLTAKSMEYGIYLAFPLATLIFVISWVALLVKAWRQRRADLTYLRVSAATAVAVFAVYAGTTVLVVFTDEGLFFLLLIAYLFFKWFTLVPVAWMSS